jgi:hypothetical protein
VTTDEVTVGVVWTAEASFATPSPLAPKFLTLRFTLRRNAIHAVHHWRSMALFAYSWQVQSRVGSTGSTHVVE